MTGFSKADLKLIRELSDRAYFTNDSSTYLRLNALEAKVVAHMKGEKK